MDIGIRRIGSPARQLLGLVQSPMAGRPRRAAYLLCRPFGQEAVRSAPVYRAVSDRLAREGFTVLTIDHHGCGDSPGEPDEQTLDAWAGDTLAADAQLRIDAPGTPVHWFGMGLGANIAALATLRAREAPQCIVLWEPVLDGPAYLEQLVSVHRTELAREMQRDWRMLATEHGEPEPQLPGSVLGFTVGARLHAELLGVRELPLREVAGRGTRIVLAVPEAQARAWSPKPNPNVTVQAVETPTQWMAVEARGTAIVPQEIPRTLLATLQSDFHG